MEKTGVQGTKCAWGWEWPSFLFLYLTVRNSRERYLREQCGIYIYIYGGGNGNKHHKWFAYNFATRFDVETVWALQNVGNISIVELSWWAGARRIIRQILVIGADLFALRASILDELFDYNTMISLISNMDGSLTRTNDEDLVMVCKGIPEPCRCWEDGNSSIEVTKPNYQCSTVPFQISAVTYRS